MRSHDAKRCLNPDNVRPRFDSAKLTPATMRGVVLVALSALMLIAARPAQAQTETVIWGFNALPDSSLVFDGAGNLYGTTWAGGAVELGTVYELSPNGSGGWNEAVLYSFCAAPNCTDGARPSGPLVFDSAGNLYGTAAWGGNNACADTAGCGLIFELSPAGAGWTETVLYTFCPDGTCAGGANPETGVIFDRAGNLWGITSSGSGDGNAVVFELSPSAKGWTNQTIYQAGASFSVGLTMDSAGNIFGLGFDAVFELSPNGTGGWNPTTIYNFTSAAVGPPAGAFVADKTGNLYGAASGGGANQVGTVYRLSPGASGWTEKTLYSFRKKDKNGYSPSAGIVFDAAGNIYGVTDAGGEFGYGTVFELVAPVDKGAYTEKILSSFDGWEGLYPTAGLILDSAGNLYGTTEYSELDNGIAYEVTGVPVTTTTTLTSSPNPSTYGEAVTVTAAVTSLYGALPPNGETVSFMQGKAVLGTGTLSGGSASLSISTLNVGTASVSAVYGGDTSFLGSTSNTVKQKVKKAAN
jgi:uncharacterized repeat protein (TIGR03803 family)